MEWRALGASGLQLPVIGMGTWRTFDVYGKEAQAARRMLIDRALDLDVAFFDSSPMYGEAEHVLGAALTGRRYRARIATKVWAHEERDGQAQIDRALYFFEGRVDLYQVHNLVNWRAYLPVFERMKSAGTLRASGVTHYLLSELPELVGIVERGLVDAVQVPYGPLVQAAGHELLPLARERGVGVVVMQPFLGGRLAAAQPPMHELGPFKTFGVSTWPQVLLKWILSEPAVTSVIPATSRVRHLEENAIAGDPPWFGPEERSEVVRIARRYAGIPD
jgi:aryl-alcohol dehydrogenase-like predicted oxidoreductase